MMCKINFNNIGKYVICHTIKQKHRKQINLVNMHKKQTGRKDWFIWIRELSLILFFFFLSFYILQLFWQRTFCNGKENILSKVYVQEYYAFILNCILEEYPVWENIHSILLK